MIVNRLEDSAVKWVTRRDILAHFMDKSKGVYKVYCGSDWHRQQVQGVVDELKLLGHGRYADVVLLSGAPPDDETAGKITCRINPWTGEVTEEAAQAEK